PPITPSDVTMHSHGHHHHAGPHTEPARVYGHEQPARHPGLLDGTRSIIPHEHRYRHRQMQQPEVLHEHVAHVGIAMEPERSRHEQVEHGGHGPGPFTAGAFGQHAHDAP